MKAAATPARAGLPPTRDAEVHLWRLESAGRSVFRQATRSRPERVPAARGDQHGADRPCVCACWLRGRAGVAVCTSRSMAACNPNRPSATSSMHMPVTTGGRRPTGSSCCIRRPWRATVHRSIRTAVGPQRSQKLTRVCSIKLTHHEVSDVGTDQTGSCAPIYA